MFNEHLSVTGECKGTGEVFFHDGTQMCRKYLKLYWKCIIGTTNKNHLFSME